jgi:hypothetical protein
MSKVYKVTVKGNDGFEAVVPVRDADNAADAAILAVERVAWATIEKLNVELVTEEEEVL